MIVYLAGPVDRNPDKQHQWRAQARAVLQDRGHFTFDPYSAFLGHPCPPDYARVCSINRQAMIRCDALLVKLDFSVPMFGTIREIELARLQTPPLPVVVFGEEGIIEHAESHDLVVMPDLQRALAHLINDEFRRG